MNDAVSAAVADAHRREWANVLAATVRITRDLSLAEECAQDAFERAVRRWPRTGVPERPGAWLTTVAANRARDILRRESAFTRRIPLLVVEAERPQVAETDPDAPEFVDDRLRLIFLCCHPALARESQVALTLRLVCGLTTAEIARAFLVRETTMAARITRAKKKIASASIPFRIPAAEHLPARVSAVCEVLYLVFTTGHTSPAGAQVVRADLVDAAIRMARILHVLVPGDSDACGILALMLLIDARRAARESAPGTNILLPDQDRSTWNGAQIDEGLGLLQTALRVSPPSSYSVEAAIAAVHAEAPDWQQTDWQQIVGLYDVLRRLRPSPVVELNRAIALGHTDGATAALDALQPLLDEPALATYGYLSAARGYFLGELQRWPEAREAYREALALTDNEAERRTLGARIAEISSRLT